VVEEIHKISVESTNKPAKQDPIVWADNNIRFDFREVFESLKKEPEQIQISDFS